jgi:ATP-binding protein involved in chromosome partitioning
VNDLSTIRSAVEGVEDPDLRASIGSLGMVAEIAGDAKNPQVTIAFPLGGHPSQAELISRIELAVAGAGAEKVELTFTAMSDDDRIALSTRLRGSSPTDRDVTVGKAGSGTRVVGIASGKGGVGKSSVTVNLVIALTKQGQSVGIMDADVWGFSIPKMLGVNRAPSVLEELLIPPVVHDVAVMSMDFFVDPDQAVVWRGPMLHKALEQFLVDVYWGDIDYLLIDMPPGTGDVSISISQYLPNSEIVVVTTPQPAAQRVAIKAGLMAAKVNQEVVGVIENMSWFTGDDGKRYELFGSGGGAAVAEDLGVPFLGQIPLVPELREGSDTGNPVTVTDPAGDAALAFDRLAVELMERRPRLRSHPELVIS